MRRLLAVAAALVVVVGADTPTGTPIGIDQVLGLGPSGILAFIVFQIATGKLVSSALHDRAEARATEATAAAALSNKTAADAIAALAKVSMDSTTATANLTAEIAGLTRELDRRTLQKRG